MKNKKILFLLFIILYYSCGIEDVLFFERPENLKFDETENYIKFDGYNQEIDGNEYVFLGYEVWYYFTSSSEAKMAQVKYPENIYHDADGPFPEFVNFTDNRFNNFTSKNQSIYQKITIPVTDDMIKNILTEGNEENVIFTFNDSDLSDASNDDNPQIYSNDFVFLYNVYPNYSEYKNKDWGNVDQDFRGFFDADYYVVNNIDYSEKFADYKLYKMYLYVVARGFNDKGMALNDLQSSIKSDTIEVYIEVKDETLHDSNL